MAAKTYKTQAIILKKTRLGEKDLILTLLDETGELQKAVAKGARKPGGSHAAKTDLFCTIDGLFAQGRSLDVLCDARLLDRTISPEDIARIASASPVAELLSLVGQPDLPQPRLYPMAQAAFKALGQAKEESLPFLCTAALWKILSRSGFRPSFDRCVRCGGEISGGTSDFSCLEGGAICSSCAAKEELPGDLRTVPVEALRWCAYGLLSRFDAMLSESHDNEATRVSFALVREWTLTHIGRDLKSLDFLHDTGLI